MYFLYSVLLLLFGVFTLPYFIVRDGGSGKYSGSFGERLGFLPASLNAASESSIWIHAVSVGEAQAAKTLIPELRARFELPIYVSVTTRTGRELAEQQLKGISGVFYCPFDLGFVVRRVVRRLNPSVLLVIETEIWPQLIHQVARHGAVTILVNGRISDRSFPRYRRIRFLIGPVLRRLDHLCAQNLLYRDRLIELGAEPAKISTTGSLKFDVAPPAVDESSAPVAFSEEVAVVVGGSTLAPEEDVMLDTLERLRERHPNLCLVLAPRHPERFDEVYNLCVNRKLRTVRRSQIKPGQLLEACDVFLLDSIGELAALYAVADIVFVGGSLAAWGGHNIIEPALFAKPILFGPHMENFRDIAQQFLEAEAGIRVADSEALTHELNRLLTEPESGREIGMRARELIELNQGAARQTVELVHRLVHRV